jgi:hypothetical protein
MKYLRKQNLNINNVLDDTVLQRADGNVELNPTDTVYINGNLEISGDINVKNAQLDNENIFSTAETFNLLNKDTKDSLTNDGPTTVNAFLNTTALNLGASTGLTTVNNALRVDGNTTLGLNTNNEIVLRGTISGSLKDNIDSAFDLSESTNSYIKINTTDGSENVVFGTVPKLLINNDTDSTNKDTGAVVVEGGVGIEKSMYVGADVYVANKLGFSQSSGTSIVYQIYNSETDSLDTIFG